MSAGVREASFGPGRRKPSGSAPVQQSPFLLLCLLLLKIDVQARTQAKARPDRTKTGGSESCKVCARPADVSVIQRGSWWQGTEPGCSRSSHPVCHQHRAMALCSSWPHVTSCAGARSQDRHSSRLTQVGNPTCDF